MVTYTTNYDIPKPGINDPTDQDLWGGYLNTGMDIIDTTVKSVADLVPAPTQLPVGSLYFNASDATNPATILGYGTWTAFGEGRVILGVGTGTDINGANLVVTPGATGGEYANTLSASQIPSHTHTARMSNNPGGNNDSFFANTGGSGGNNVTSGGSGIINTGSAGSGQSHNNTQPYIGVYIWVRTV